jgi:hypothetical protein
MFVLCELYSKDKRHSQDNQDEELVQMKQREQKIKFPMESLEFFSDNPSGCIVALESTQPLTEMSTRNSSWE